MSEPSNDFAPGVLTGNEVKEVFALAKAKGFALPAANCIGSNSMNAVMETAAKLNSPVIIQFSNSGGAFIAGKAIGVDKHQAAVLGSIAGAQHVHGLAAAYGARVILHTDHCAKKLLPWVDGLLDAGEAHFAATGKPLFSSHMLDLSEEPIEENVEICEALPRADVDDRHDARDRARHHRWRGGRRRQLRHRRERPVHQARGGRATCTRSCRRSATGSRSPPRSATCTACTSRATSS